jgi:hypothetical protein
MHKITDATQTMVKDARHARRIARIERGAEATARRGRPYTLRLHGYVSERNATESMAYGMRPIPQTVTVTVLKAWHAQTGRFTVLGIVTEGNEVVVKAYNLAKVARVCYARTPAAHYDAWAERRA